MPATKERFSFDTRTAKPIPPAPANDFITAKVTLTREEWRYIEQTADHRRNGGSAGHSAQRSSAWEKLYKQIRGL